MGSHGGGVDGDTRWQATGSMTALLEETASAYDGGEQVQILPATFEFRHVGIVGDMEGKKMTEQHRPDRCKLPILAKWKPLPEGMVWEDGTQILVAVPIVGNKDWYYEYSVLTIKCDEYYFELECDDGPWGWEWTDIDFYVQLSGAKPVPMDGHLSDRESGDE